MSLFEKLQKARAVEITFFDGNKRLMVVDDCINALTTEFVLLQEIHDGGVCMCLDYNDLVKEGVKELLPLGGI